MTANTFVHGDGALKVVKFDRHGAWYAARKVHLAVIASICGDQTNYFTHRAAQMNHDVAKATQLTDEAVAQFGKSLEALQTREKEITEVTRKVGGQVRDATQKLSEGLSKIEKIANFDRLERLVELLERASTAVNALAEMDAAGKLAKIADVLR